MWQGGLLVLGFVSERAIVPNLWLSPVLHVSPRRTSSYTVGRVDQVRQLRANISTFFLRDHALRW